MTAKLSDDVKLVGPSINCEESVTIEGDLSRSNPHVQSFAVATDQVGESQEQLQMLVICACHERSFPKHRFDLHGNM